jgi:cell division transport system permease protein
MTMPRRSGPRTPDASTAAQGIVGRGKSWLVNHGVVARQSLTELIRAWGASMMTWLVIGIALALPAILYLLLANVGGVSADWAGKPKLSVYLVQQADEEAGVAFTAVVAKMPSVASATYISRAEALREFQAMSGFGDVLTSLDSNPLPAVVEVVPSVEQPVDLRLLVVNLEAMELVESVSLDLAWIERLFAMLALGQRFVTALAFFLALGVLLSIGNTIRLAIENRRAEIEVVKLVGGTDGFVRRPFLYLGFWYGLGGAMIAWIMVEISLMLLAGPVDRLVRSYDDEFSLIGFGWGASFVLLATGAVLGILGAVIAVGRHLHEIEPQ